MYNNNNNINEKPRYPRCSYLTSEDGEPSLHMILAAVTIYATHVPPFVLRGCSTIVGILFFPVEQFKFIPVVKAFLFFLLLR